MANPKHLSTLKKGVEAFNEWRRDNPEVKPNLNEADLSGTNLSNANLSKADLGESDLSVAELSGTNFTEANLEEANLVGADLGSAKFQKANLTKADLSGANLSEADLSRADLTNATLSRANLSRVNLSDADLTDVNLHKADLRGADLSWTKLTGANLSGANLNKASLCVADLIGTNLVGANLREADLSRASLVMTNLKRADLTGCYVYGTSVWDAQLDGAKQSNLIITLLDEPLISVDNLEVAQFIYLLLSNMKIRNVIDTITSKVVLILGRFTPERKDVLDQIRERVREMGYVPVLFDFEKPTSKDLTGTVSTLANMARFIIADLTDPSSVPHELATIVPSNVVPVQPILLKGQREYAMFVDLNRRYHWVLPPYEYKTRELLIAHLGESVIAPAEAKAKELIRK